MNIELLRELAKEFRHLLPPRKSRSRRRRKGPNKLYCPSVKDHRNCGWCGDRFETGRLTGDNAAKFCSRSCKQKNRRWRKDHPGFSTRQEFLEKNKHE